MKRYQRGHIGEFHKSNQGCHIKIIDGGSKPGYCTVRIYGGVEIYENEHSYQCVKNGSIKNLYYPSVANKGYIGVGDYKVMEKTKQTIAYSKWHSMVYRCYNKTNNEEYYTYKNATVCDEWLNFQNFAKWFHNNYIKYDNYRTEIDKDILGKNKIYSPEYCLLIPRKLNSFFTNEKTSNKSGYTGVYYSKNKKQYIAKTRDFKTGKRIQSKWFNNLEDANIAYKKLRKKQCKIVKEICINKWNITDEKILNNIK